MTQVFPALLAGVPVSGADRARVAVLIDGDNIAHGALAVIEAAAADLGAVVIRRVYCDVTVQKAWEAEPLVQAVHTGHGSGKNATDIRLVIDAMDLAHRGLATGFVIASTDSDFAPLAIWLREAGYGVLGVGRAETARRFQAACSGFRLLPAVAAKPALSALDKRLRQVIGAGLDLQALGCAMRGETVKAQTGCATWRAYLAGKPALYRVQDAKVQCLP